MKPLQTLQDNPQLLRDIQERLEALEALVSEILNVNPPTPPPEPVDGNTLHATVCYTTSSKEQSQKAAFLEAIHRIGIEDVKTLELERKGNPFIMPATEKVDPPKGYARSKCGKYFVDVVFNVKDKAKKLREISDKLCRDMTIKVVFSDGMQKEY